MAEVLVGNEWIAVEESAARLRDAVSDAGEVDTSAAPMTRWVAFKLSGGRGERTMRVALGSIHGIRWDEDDESR